MILYASTRGVVLLAVLIFLEVFCILGFFAMQSNVWENKLTHRFWAKSSLDSAAKSLQQAIENNVNLATTVCRIPEAPVPVIASKTLAWWQSVSCAGIFRLFQYYYIIEFRGNDPCAYLVGFDQDSQLMASYYRVTLLIMSRKDPGQKRMLQSSIVRPIRQDGICTGPRHGVMPGRQGWQELI